MRSLSEIDTVSKRSSRAAGYSWGIAEEIGKNIRLLEIFSLPGIKNLNSFFKKKAVFCAETDVCEKRLKAKWSSDLGGPISEKKLPGI